MIIPVVPLAILGLAVGAHVASRRRAVGQLTPERLDLLEAALRTEDNPARLRELAQQFKEAELPQLAQLLQRRAAIIELPLEQKNARKAVFRKAMASRDPAKILEVATAFARDGCLGAADSLKRQAHAVQALLEAEARMPAKEAPKEAPKDETKAA